MLGLLFCFCVISSGIIVNKMILQVLPVIFFVGFRMTIGGLILFLLSFRRSHRLRWSYIKKDWLILLGAVLFTNCVPALLKAYGLKNLLASKACLFGSLDPFVTALFAYFLLSERLNKKKVLGIVVAFIGALVLSFSASPIEKTLHAFLFFSFPELAMLGYVMLSRYGWMLLQILLKRERYTPPEINSLTMLGAGILSLTTSFFLDDFAGISIASPWHLTGLLVYTILVGNVIGYTLYSFFLKKYSASMVSLSGFSVPIFVALLGWIILREQLSINLLASAVFIFIGVYIFYQDEIKTLLKQKKLQKTVSDSS